MLNTKTLLDRFRAYGHQMHDLFMRATAFNSLLRVDGESLSCIVLVECLYLQLRNMLELLASGLLYLNQDSLNEGEANGVWHALEMIDLVEARNPDFFPVPARECEPDKDGIPMIEVAEIESLTRSSFTTLYDYCGRVLHTQNPLGGRKAAPTLRVSTVEDCSRYVTQAIRWQRRITNLVDDQVVSVDGDLYRFHLGESADNFSFALLSVVKHGKGAASRYQSRPLPWPPAGTG